MDNEKTAIFYRKKLERFLIGNFEVDKNLTVRDNIETIRDETTRRILGQIEDTIDDIRDGFEHETGRVDALFEQLSK